MYSWFFPSVHFPVFPMEVKNIAFSITCFLDCEYSSGYNVAKLVEHPNCGKICSVFDSSGLECKWGTFCFLKVNLILSRKF